MRVPANVPVQSYWSLTAYDVDHFDLVAAPSARPNVSSIMAPEMQLDGSFGLTLGPNVKGRNSIQTVPGRGYFVIIRLFGPPRPYLEGLWKLPDMFETTSQAAMPPVRK